MPKTTLEIPEALKRWAISEDEADLIDFSVKISRDGNQWCALLGRDLVDGLAGFGDSIADALADLACCVRDFE